MKKITFSLILFCFLISSCEYFSLMSKKEWTEKADIEDDDVVIYLSGGFYDSIAGQYLPCYWKITKDGYKRVDLESGNTWGIAYSIYVVGDTVYTCGFDQNLPVVHVRACYWINKKKYPLDSKNPSTQASHAMQIIVKNGVPFTAGDDDTDNDSDAEAVYWMEQSSNSLFTGSESYARSIFIQQISSSRHIMYFGGDNDGHACYWKNGQIFNLEDDSAANSAVNSIYVIGNIVYSVGDLNNDQASLWENNNLTKLPGGNQARSVFVSGNDVYIAGQYESGGDFYPCYWKNKNRHLIPGSSFGVGTNAYAYSVFVYNDNLYIAGVDDDSGTNVRAWYWINNKKNYIDQSLNAGVLSIFVKADND